MKVFLKFYAEKNLGDDLFLKIILERYPDIEFYLVADDRYKRSPYKNLFILNRIKQSKLERGINVIAARLSAKIYKKRIVNYVRKNNNYISKCDLFVSLGGSIFIQKKKRPCYLELEVYKYAILESKKIFILGSNFGPFLSQDYKDNCKYIFSSSEDVSFRDQASYKLFSALDNVRLNPDIVFGLNLKTRASCENKSVGFSITNERNGIDKERYFSSLAALIELYQEHDYKIYLFSFCKEEGDQATIEELCEKLNGIGITKVYYNNNIDEFISIYSKIEKMYCGRFHSMILSMILGQKIYPIVYSDKMSNVLQDINYQGSFIKIENLADCCVENLFNDIENNVYDVTLQKRNSEKHFTKLDSILKQKA